MFNFITNRPLWINIIVGIAMAVGLFALILLSLNLITNHGHSSTVPSITGMKYEDAKLMLKKAGFEVEIQDSVYVDTMSPMSVIKQFPDADEVVKANRTVYVVLNRLNPPLIEMPNLVGYSFRNAEMLLKSMGLRMGDTTFKPDFAKNAILEQHYKGKPIATGTQIRKGSVISFVLGDGVGNKEFIVPVITGMTFCDARQRLDEYGIIIGAIVPDSDVNDTCNAWIYKQYPERLDDEKKVQRIRSGQTIDVWLQLEKPVKDTSKIQVTLPE